jgi:hypothetical protein
MVNSILDIKVMDGIQKITMNKLIREIFLKINGVKKIIFP